MRKKLIGLPLVEKILGWRHTGFNVHKEVRAKTRGEAERVGKYMRHKVYEKDSLLCPKCGSRMRIITFVEDYKVIDRIIRHLKQSFEAERPPPLHNVQRQHLMAAL